MQLRPAEPDDARLLWHWANDPVTRERSFDPAPIGWDEHVRWFERVRSDPDHLVLVGCDPEPVGLVRFHREGQRATISVNVAPGSRGRGVGTRLIAAGTRHCLSTWDVEAIDAYIKPSNQASLRAFQAAGYDRSEDVHVDDTEALRLVAVRPSP